jgi:hypothetical protein
LVWESKHMQSNIFLKALLVMPAALSIALFSGSPTLAAEEVDEAQQLIGQSAPAVDSAPVSSSAPLSSTPDAALLDQINRYTDEASRESISQVTSISQLSDVQPTDWAFQALQSLVERYGCIAGYPDGTYRGSRAMTRYEFAAGMNACLDRVNELIAAGLADVVTREDLATLQRLQEEFAAELATLRGRVDGLEARTAELEANQFSTTTRLVGRTQFFVAGAFDEDDDLDTDPFEVDDDDDSNNGEGIDPASQIFFGYRVRLSFDTSFTGTDLLRARLQARNIPNFGSDPIGFQASGNSSGNVQLDDLYYRFRAGDRLGFLIGAEGVDIDDLVPSVTYPLGASSDSGALSEFADPRQYETGFAGTGAAFGVSYDLVDQDNFGVNLSGGYVADNAADPTQRNGLFNGDYSAIGQLTFTSDLFDLALTYVNAYSVGAEFNARLYDVEGPQIANTYGAQVNFKLFDNSVQIGGGGALINVNGIGTAADYEIWSYQGTLAFPNLGGEGNLLGLVAGVLPYTRELEDQTTDTGFLGEVFYRYALTDNIALTPSVIYISDPFNDNDNSETIIGALRTTFSF